MNRAKCSDYDYIHFLLASQKVFSAVEASACEPREGVAHDAYTRLLQRTPPDSKKLWEEVQDLVDIESGILVIDDTTLDKPHAKKMAMVTRHWSGNHKRVVNGINLITLLWTDGKCRLPTDFRIYNKAEDGKTKNDHFQEMVQSAKNRGLTPQYVCFDSWYSSLDNLKYLRTIKWHWITRLKSNRQVSLRTGENQAIRTLLIPANGLVVHLKGYGWIKVFRTTSTHGYAEFWATSDLNLSIEACAFFALDSWQIEVYHQGIKQHTGIDRCQCRSEIAQRNHIGFALRAFIRLEYYRLRRSISWGELKRRIIRHAISDFLEMPWLLLPSTA